MLLISNEDVSSVVSITDCVEAIEEVYRELGTGSAVLRPRSVIQVPHGGTTSYTLASMDGVSRASGVAAIRIRSDLSTLEAGRKTKFAGRPGSFCGLILLFDLETAAPVAIFNDGILQQMRVAATAAVAGRRLARADSRTLGILGAGGQARSHAAAYTAVLPIERIRVYSPTESSREAFAVEVSEELGVPVEPVGAAHEVFESDVVATCTNATSPVFPGDWLLPGSHVSSVRHWAEIGEDVIDRADVVVIHQEPLDTWHILTDSDSAQQVQEGKGAAVPAGAPTLSDLLSGNEVARRSDRDVTYFLNNVGTGIQFAACAGLALRRCLEAGIGRELPTEWFLQHVSD